MQTRTSVFRSLALFGAIAFGVAACEPKTEVILPAEPTSIDVQPGSLTLTVGQSQALSINVVNPPPGQTANPTCTSSNPAVASISGGCVVTGVSVGSTSITVSSGTTPAFTRTVGVTVTARTTIAQITLTPQTATIGRGDSIVVVASVSGVQNTGVIFRTSDASVATVQDMGTTAVVRGVSNGTAVITAIAEADTTIRASSTIQVGGGQGSGSIGFGTITQFNTNSPVDPANVQGRIDVTLNVVPGDNDQLRVVVLDADGMVVDTVDGCSRSFGGSSSASQTVTCTLNTAEFDSAGVAAFTNGNFTLEARLLNGGDISVSAQSNVLAFRNVDILSARVSRDTSAIGADGLLWNGGDITFNLRPVTFSGQAGASTAQATVTLTGSYLGDTTSVTRTDTDASNGLSVTFPASSLPSSNGIREFNTGPDGANVTISSVTAGGQQGASGRFGPQCSVASPPAGCTTFVYTDLQSGTSGVNNVLRVDNQSPIANEAPTDDDARQLLRVTFPTVAGADPVGGFLNASARFSRGVSVLTFGTPGDPSTATQGSAGSLPDDAPYGTTGVDLVTVDFRAVNTGPAGATLTNANAPGLFASGTPVDSAGDLRGTTTPDQFVVVARVSDRLGNSDFVLLTRPDDAADPNSFTPLFGVDLFRPVVSFSTEPANPSIPDTAIIRTDMTSNFVISFSDEATTEAQGGPSGFGPTPVRVSLARYAADALGGSCYALSDSDMDNAYEGVASGGGRGAAPSCTFYNTNGIVEVPAADGYYIIRAFTVDRAGNASADTITRIVLRDDAAPTVTISSFSVSSTQLRFTGNSQDNVDLRNYDVRLQFGGGVNVPVTTLFNAGMYGLPLNTNQAVDQLTPVIRQIQIPDATGAVTGSTTFALSGGGFGAIDVSGLFAQAFQGVTAPVGDGVGTIDGSPSQIDSVRFALPQQNVTVCNNSSRSGCTSSTPLTAEIAIAAIGPTNTFQRPFTQVYFYYQDPVINELIMFATATDATATERIAPTIARTWTYRAMFNGAGKPNPAGPAGTQYPLFALGITADGDAFFVSDAARTVTLTVDGIVYVAPM